MMSSLGDGPERGRGEDGWVAGVMNGEIKSSISDSTAYAADDNAYNGIDVHTMRFTSFDFQLELFVMELPHELDFDDRAIPSHSEWQDLSDLLTERYSDPLALISFPETIAALLEEPVVEGEDPKDTWTDHYEDLIADLTAESDYRPDAVILEEPCNWVEVPHDTPASTSGRVASSEVRDFITEAQLTPMDESEPSNGNMDAWAYMIEWGALMIGIDAWAFGDEVLETGTRRVVYNDDVTSAPYDREEIGFKFNYTCPSTITDLDLSFLHYDLDGQDNGLDVSDRDDREDLRLHVYIQASGSAWREIGETSPHYYTGDTYGGFRFNDPDRDEGVELIVINDISSTEFLCDDAPHGIKIVAECHAEDGACDGCNSSESSSCGESQGDGDGVSTKDSNLPNFGYVGDVQLRKIRPYPLQITRERLDLDAGATRVEPFSLDTTKTRLTSKSNSAYRYLERPVLVPQFDSVVIRHGHGLLGECAGASLADCSAAQRRLMQALSDALGASASRRLFSYFEAQTWYNALDRDWIVEMLKNTEANTDGLIGGHYSLAYWELVENSGVDYGEFAQRDEIHPGLDENTYSGHNTAIDDHYSLLFFHPYDRKQDPVPGWYQKYSTTFDFSADPGAPAEMTYEVARWKCGGCGDLGYTDEALSPDTVIEFAFTRTDVWPFQKWSQVFVLEDLGGDFPKITGDSSAALPYRWNADEGIWKFEVIMYSIDKPAGNRHGFFRFLEINPSTLGEGVTYEIPGGWTYETGLWPMDSADPYAHPLTLALNEYNTKNDPDAPDQAQEIMGCLWWFWTDTSTWETSCL